MQLIKKIFKNGKINIVISIIVVIFTCFLMFYRQIDRLYGSNNIYRSKNISISCSSKVQSETAYQALWWKKDLFGNFILNKSANLSDNTTEVYMKTGWNETKLVEVSEEQNIQISCYGPTLLGARLDAGIYDIDKNDKNEQVYYYSEIAVNGRGFDEDEDGEWFGFEDENENGYFNKDYDEYNKYNNFKYNNFIFEDTEIMSLGIIPLEDGFFQLFFRGIPLANTNIKVVTESGHNEMVTTNDEGYFYIGHLKRQTRGINIIYIDHELQKDKNVYHILSYNAKNLNYSWVVFIGKVIFLVIAIILAMLGVNKLLLMKKNKNK